MVDIDKVQTAGALAEMLRRAVREKRIELLRDEETDARAALVPWELLLELAEAGGPPMEELRGRGAFTREPRRHPRHRAPRIADQSQEDIRDDCGHAVGD